MVNVCFYFVGRIAVYVSLVYEAKKSKINGWKGISQKEKVKIKSFSVDLLDIASFILQRGIVLPRPQMHTCIGPVRAPFRRYFQQSFAQFFLVVRFKFIDLYHR